MMMKRLIFRVCRNIHRSGDGRKRRAVCVSVLLVLLCALLSLTGCRIGGEEGAEDVEISDTSKESYGVFLGIDSKSFDVNLFDEYDLVVVDAQELRPDQLAQLHARGHVVYSYLNVGSIETNRDYFSKYKDLCLFKYENWPDEYWVDVTQKKWQKFTGSGLVDRIRARGIAISPGRGASPSSIVCYCLGITEVDPVQFRLLSGRFIWKGRTTLPSIDLDIEDGRWDEAFSILSDMFGHDRVALIPVYKTKSIHSTALVVSKGNLSDYLPVKIAIGHPNEDYSLITQYELKWMEGSGAVPLNIISLHALQVLKKTIDLISDRKGEDVDLYSIPLDDAKTLALFASGNTSDIFMFQAKGMQKWLRDFAPDSFSDLVLLNTLYRPGLMDSLPLCLARKRGKEEAKYEIPGLKVIFKV